LLVESSKSRNLHIYHADSNIPRLVGRTTWLLLFFFVYFNQCVYYRLQLISITFW
jgi:hypothetical protein